MNKQALALAVGLAMVQPQAVSALSLGDVRVESALSQPLRARIDLQDIAANELSDLSIRVASESLFQRMGMERPFVLNNLKFDTVLYGNQPALMIHTRYPFNEPFLHVLLEVSHQNQVVLQEYTLMPEMPQAQASSRADAGRRYAVKRGDTLFKIANRFRYAGTTSNQMMLAIVQRNPGAFIRGDGNRLKANVDMIIPSRQTVNAVSRRDAQSFRERLVKKNLSEKTLGKQPFVQPERSTESLSELEQARQHLKSLREKARDVSATLQKPELTERVIKDESLADQGDDFSVSQSTIRRLNAQLEVKELKIAELQMRLARLNKKMLVEQEATVRPDIHTTDTEKTSVVDATTLEASRDFKPALVVAPTSLAQHTIDMAGLPKAKSGSPSPGDADERAANTATSNNQQRTHQPVMIKEVQQLPHTSSAPVSSTVTTHTVDTVAASANNNAVQAAVLPEAKQDVAPTNDSATQVEAPIASVEAPVEQAIGVSGVAPSAASPNSVLPDNDVDKPTDLLAMLTSPLALYLELAAFVLLAFVWLYARHQRRKWRLVDDVVRDLEVKRAEEGREKLLWDKLVYAPHDWMIALPEAMEQEVAPEAESKEPTQLPDVEQLEALLKNDKMKVRQSASRHQPVFPASFLDDEDTHTPLADEANETNNEQMVRETSAMPSVEDSPSALPGTQVEILRRQIDEMQRMLESLQQHRSYLEQQRDAA